MKTILATLALAGSLGGGLLTSAQAQTITGVDSAGTAQYTVQLTPTVTNSAGSYAYDYLATLVSDPGGVGVNSFTFNFGSTVPVGYVSNTGGFTESSLTPGVFFFGSNTGLKTGDSTTFSFLSPLPPTGTVAVASTSPAQAGGGTSAVGPGPVAVPEPASLALLGLGALPLGLAVRRRRLDRN